jgi:hypothetical protein
MYHGWADAAVTPQLTVDYYEAAEKKKMGGRKATQGFLRLFMIPGSTTAGGSRGVVSRSLDSIRSRRSKLGGTGRSASDPACHQAGQRRQDRLDQAALPLPAEGEIQGRRRKRRNELRLLRLNCQLRAVSASGRQPPVALQSLMAALCF